MRLKRFDYQLPKKNYKKQITMAITICVLAIIAVSSYALYKMLDSKDFVDTTVGEFTNADVTVKILVDGEKQEAFPAKGTGYIFDSVTCTNGATGTFNKTTWELSVSDIGQRTECTVQFVPGEESIAYLEQADTSGAGAPDLDNGLIPVVYDGEKWIKADITKNWYSYDEQRWANAVTVKAANRSTYTNVAVGTEIPMSAINTMWVWIPRYEYQTSNLGTASTRRYAGGTQAEPGGININFISKETTTASSSNFKIHPAFTFGTQQLSGIWVAKFELSTGDTTCTPVYLSEGTRCDLPTIKPFIIPNVASWTGARTGTFFTAIQNQMNGSNGTTTYGIINSDTHMMKNVEWAAVAYLSQSKYGKYGNTAYTGTDKEIYMNGSSSRITGNSNGTPSQDTRNTQIAYNVEGTGTGASTTGTIYGVYDMSGGSCEYIMGIMKESTNTEVAVGRDTTYNSGFSGKLSLGADYTGTYGNLKDIDTKYYDIYEYGTTENDTAAYQRGHQGDATYEIAGWYQDGTDLMDGYYCWGLRSGWYGGGSGVGVFLSGGNGGHADDIYTTRTVLVEAN